MDVPVTRLRCTSWDQLAEIFARDIRRGALTIRTRTPPPVGSVVTIALILPSGTTLALAGTATMCTPTSDGGTRLEVQLRFAAGDLWMIESALAGARSQGLIKVAPAAPTAGTTRTSQSNPTVDGPGYTPVPAPLPTAPPPSAPPPSAPGHAASAESTALEEDPSTAALEGGLMVALEAEIDGLLGKDSYQILGVARSASIDDIDAAYAKLSLKYHPDAYARFTNQRLWDLAGELYVMMSDAHARVTSPQAQSARLASGLTTTLGDARLNEGRWEDAAKQFEESLRIDPGNHGARVGHEIARAMHFLEGGGAPERAVAHLEALGERAPSDDRVARAIVEARRRATTASRRALEAEMGEDRS